MYKKKDKILLNRFFSLWIVPAVFVLSSTAIMNTADATSIKIVPEQAIIIVPPSPDNFQKLAADELQYHLKLITNTIIPIRNQKTSKKSNKFTFYIGIKPLKDNKPFNQEEMRWVIAPSGAWFYGNPDYQKSALFSVYCFLERQLGVRWIEPGEIGIVHPNSKILSLQTGHDHWIPKVESRRYRTNFRERFYPKNTSSMSLLAGFIPSHQQWDQWEKESQIWTYRMRFQWPENNIPIGHAFIGWWNKYHKKHPEYFAINKWGQREPELKNHPPKPGYKFTKHQKQTVKLNISNPDVTKQIVQNWLNEGKKAGTLSPWINVCMNDGDWGFATGPDNRNLDATPPGKKWQNYLSDRYVYLANQVIKTARRYDPNVKVSMYAYNATLQPPLKHHLEPGIAVTIVPVTLNPENLNKLFKGWKEAGATYLGMRPNYPYHYETIGMPIGFAKQMYNALQVALKYDVVLVDYDKLMGHWRYFGLTDYVLSRKMSFPNKSFLELVKEYCSAFGPASTDIQAYYKYWRVQLWQKRIKPHLHEIIENGKFNNFARGLRWSKGKYYRDKDFKITKAILERAAKEPLTSIEKKRLNELMIAQHNAYLTFKAISTKPPKKFKYSKKLLQFRLQHQNDPYFYWYTLFEKGKKFGDQTGIFTALHLKSYSLPWIQTRSTWRFKADPNNVGLKNKWQDLPWSTLEHWGLLKTYIYWGNPHQTLIPKKLRNILKNYTGIGWYATRIKIPSEFKGRDIYLYFGAIDDSGWVYVNGKLAGKHLYQHRGDDTEPFHIEITNKINQQQQWQNIVVRVQNKAGAGGIWKRIWLVSKKNKKNKK